MDNLHGCDCGSCSISEQPSTKLPHLPRIALSAVLLLFAMFGFSYMPGLAGVGGAWPVVVYLFAYLLVGWPVVRSAMSNILRGRVFDEMFLMTIATAGAFAIGEYPEAVAVMLFYSVGEYFQELAVGRSRRSIAALMDLRPETVRVVLESGVFATVPENVDVGALVEVLPGERVPLDGSICSGESAVDTSALTGESVPRSVTVGDELSAGYINTSGLLRMRVSRPYQDSALARILRLVQEAAERKAPTERMITRFARVYTPIVVGVAVAVAVLPPLLIPGALFSDWLYRALVVLVISCPCALVVSIPLSYFAGIGGASRNGVLVKGANYLDALKDLHTLVLDKTGTLTRGVFAVSEVVPRGNLSAGELLRVTALAESASTHPIARSIQDAYRAQTSAQNRAVMGSVSEERGYGVTAVVDGQTVLAGSHRMMHRNGVPHTDCEVRGTTVYVAVEGVYAGYIVIADQLKPEAPAMLERVRSMGVRRVVMLTGDNHRIAAELAGSLGITEYHSEFLPEDKLSLVEQLHAQLPTGRTLAFVGDGMNDAPVLTRADIGIAMGGLGSDAALEAADVILMDDNLERLPAAVLAGRYTQRVVAQNIWFTLIAKLAFMSLGAAGLAGMWVAVVGDMGVALLAVLNSTKALRPRE